MYKYQLYIGANNITKEVDHVALTTTLNQYYKGYTVSDTIGYWEGSKEDSCIVTIFHTIRDDVEFNMVAKELCGVLSQNAILVGYPDGTGELID